MDEKLIKKYMDEAKRVARYSDCLSRQVGAVIGSPDYFYIYSNGWNASPLQHLGRGCKVKGQCEKRALGFESGQGHEHCRAIHAEVSAIMRLLNEDYNAYENKVLCVTHLPCANCAKLIVASGITDVYYIEPYPDEASVRLFAEYGVTLHNVSDVVDE